MSKNILVIGGAGYIGGYLTDLINANPAYKVTVFDNLLYEKHYFKEVDFIRGDVRDWELLAKILPDFDTVVYLAAVVGDGACAVEPFVTKHVNEDSVKWLVDNFDGKIVFMSTCSVYGINDDLIDEGDTVNPISIYGKTKYNAEQYVLKNAPNHLIYRLGTLYGLGDAFARARLDLVVNILTCKAVYGEPLTVFGGEQWRPLLHVKDVGESIMWGLQNEINGLFNLTRDNMRIIDIARRIEALVPDTKIVEQDIPFEDFRNYKTKNNKIVALGWSPKFGIDAGIQEVVDVLRQGRISDVKDEIYSNVKWMKTKYRI